MIDDALFTAIVEAVAAGSPVRRAIKEKGGDTQGFYKLITSDEDKAKRYARAKELSLDAVADEIIAISDDGENDTYYDEDRKQTITLGDVIQRSRLRVDSRKWLLAKLAPKKYGDSVDLKHSGEVGLTVNINSGDAGL